MQEMPELKQVIRGFYDALAAGDVSFLDHIISQEKAVVGIGTDPDEWWKGGNTLRRKMAKQMEEMKGLVRIVGSKPIAYAEGTVGWVIDHPRLKTENGSELPIRLTAVFHKEQRAWKLVQYHTSVGVNNEEVVGRELTT